MSVQESVPESTTINDNVTNSSKGQISYFWFYIVDLTGNAAQTIDTCQWAHLAEILQKIIILIAAICEGCGYFSLVTYSALFFSSEFL